MSTSWTTTTKHVSSFSNQSKSSSSFTNQAKSTGGGVSYEFLIDSTFSFLIDNTFKLLIGGGSSGGATSWSNLTKN